jgi:hypothetical protein
MPTEWKDVKKWLSDATGTAVRESKELARKGRLQVNIMGLKHAIAEALTELGSQVYQLIQKEKTEAITGDAKVKGLIERIHDLELQLKRKEKEQKTRKYSL